MSYFADAHDLIRYAAEIDPLPGLRKCQIGALHAVSAHLTLSERPAIVVLPTGAGKTAVLMLTSFMLRATRVLVITQSRFVREQIVKDFRELQTLKRARVLPPDLPGPKLFENIHMLVSEDRWERLREYDVVVSTPNSASPSYKQIAQPPEDLFDLILIDEAHHSPAPTWSALISAFPNAQCVLFTATPFRRDGQEIKGKHVYVYPIQRAFEDNIYGEMMYIPVDAKGEEPDVALAKEVERVFREDQANGLIHALMVRADSKSRAEQLIATYRQHTSLRLGVVHSGRSVKYVTEVVQQLRNGALDGVICVNMLGEGFDLPNLKIAALHAPHRSLAVTLQFFGRFARVNGERLGEAKFLAVQIEISSNLEELYGDVESWGRRIRNIGQARIGRELFTREALDEFQPNPKGKTAASLEDLSLYSFNFLNHVKIYEVYGEVNLQVYPELTGFTTEKVWLHESRDITVFLMREAVRPKWTSAEGLERIEHHLFVIYYDRGARLLFISATCREESVYKDAVSLFVDGHPQPLSLSKINRVLRSFSQLELFNVGMRNRATGVVAESYRQLSGSAVHVAIDKEDGLLYHRGHIFGKGETATGPSTIGVSSLSKAWRLEHTRIPDFVQWCHMLARNIENPTPFTIGNGLDHLDAGHDVTELPQEVVLAADWHDDIYSKPPLLSCTASTEARTLSLLDCDIRINRDIDSTEAVVLVLSTEDAETHLKFTVSPFPAFEYLNDAQPRWQVRRATRDEDLTQFLTDNPLRFHLADGSVLEGNQYFRAVDEELPYDAESLMQAIDWEAVGVDTRREFGATGSTLRSIHEWLGDELVASEAPIVFYDHRKGECADYLTVIEDEDGQPSIRLFHCKGARGKGDSVDDLYDVCGQATKSVQWRSKRRLISHIKARAKTRSQFMKGDLALFLELVTSDPRHDFPLEVYIVQPGLSKSGLTQKAAKQLATASQGLVAVACNRLQVICSS